VAGEITITAASVAKGSDATINGSYPAGATITAGQVVYLSAANTWLLAQADGTALESGVATTLGIALHGSLSGQPLTVQTAGLITCGGTVVAATEYTVGAVAGGFCPHASLVATDKYTRVGYATTTAIIKMDVIATGVAVPA